MTQAEQIKKDLKNLRSEYTSEHARYLGELFKKSLDYDYEDFKYDAEDLVKELDLSENRHFLFYSTSFLKKMIINKNKIIDDIQYTTGINIYPGDWLNKLIQDMNLLILTKFINNTMNNTGAK